MSKTTVRESDRRPARAAAILPVRPRRSIGSVPIPMAGRDLISAEAVHDLNNALNAIRLHLDLLALDLRAFGGDPGERIGQRLRQIQPAIEAVTELSRQLSAPQGLGRSPTLVKQTRLNPVLQRMVPILSAMLPQNVDLHLLLAPDIGFVAIDSVQVIRIVSNLVLNSCAALSHAAKGSGGQVVLETANAEVPGWVALRVRDTGSGMSAAVRAKVFRPLFTTKTSRKTAGLGMTSVLRAVRRAAGKIRVESTPGKGTTVTILLPSSDATHKKQPQSLQIARAMTAKVEIARSRFGPDDQENVG